MSTEAGPFWPEPVLRTRALYLRTDWSDRTDRTSGKRLKLVMDPINNKLTFFPEKIRDSSCSVGEIYE